MDKRQAVGIFDSGVGGTSIWKEIHQLLPNEHSIYLADSINAPYGLRPKEEIVRLSFKNTEKLLKMGAKIIVVACNTATTNAIEKLRASFDIPFIGIEPAIKPAASQTRTKVIGILATKGTLSSALFAKTSDLYSRNTKVVEVIGQGLVEAIENGEIETEETRTLLKSLVDPMIAEDIDYLVLGCSHYPYLIPNLRKILPDSVKIIDSGLAVARQTEVVLKSNGLLSDTPGKAPEFFTNGNPEILRNLINRNDKSYKVSYLDF